MNVQEFEENDYITIVDEEGESTQYHIDAIFDMDHHKYVMYSSGPDTLLSRIEELDGLEYFSEVTEEEVHNLMDVYYQAIKDNKDNDGHTYH